MNVGRVWNWLVLIMTGLLSTAWGSTGMPWEAPMQQIANSLTGGFGISIASVAIAFVGIRWFRGAEHGLETMVSVVVGCAFIFGAARIVAAFSGGAGAAPVVVALPLPFWVAVSDVVGELLGHGWAVAWGYAVWKGVRDE
jgi:type IV secretion system protein TrbC